MSQSPAPAAVFFDFAGTIVRQKLSARFDVLGVEPNERIADTLALLGSHARLGILACGTIWNRERIARALHATGLERFFDPALVSYCPVDGPTRYELVAREAGIAPERCVLVCRDRNRRGFARRAGFRAVPHSGLVEPVLRGEALAFARVVERSQDAIDWEQLCRDHANVVPLHFAHDQVPVTTLIATSTSGLQALAALPHVTVETLGNAAQVEDSDLCIVRDDSLSTEVKRSFRAAVDPAALGRPLEMGTLVAVAPGVDPADFHPPACSHGDIVACTPTRALARTTGAHRTVVGTPVTRAEDAQIRRLDTALYEKHLAPWRGVGAIASRDIRHPNHDVAARRALELLGRLVGTANVHPHVFPYALGRPAEIFNVYGDIPGDPASPVAHEIVVVGAHLDAIALDTGKSVLAPGLNDDASGMAGVLAAAEVLRGASRVRPPRRTIRFALFTAEEQNLGGSREFVRDFRAAPFVAMLQMDMIGTRPETTGKLPFEIHIGRGGPRGWATRPANRELALMLAAAAARWSPLLTPQVYPHLHCPDGEPDPADHRSDHAAFMRFWPACLVAEDMFHDVCRAAQRPNGRYHTQHDTVVSAEYAAEIARTVAGAVWMRANAL